MVNKAMCKFLLVSSLVLASSAYAATPKNQTAQDVCSAASQGKFTDQVTFAEVTIAGSVATVTCFSALSGNSLPNVSVNMGIITKLFGNANAPAGWTKQDLGGGMVNYKYGKQ